MKTRVLILGGCGFIGSHVVDRFLLADYEVRVLSRSPEIFRPPLPGVDYRFGEFGNQTFLEECLKGVEIVIHLISTTTPKDSNEDMAFDIESNLIQTVRAMQLCVQAGVSKFVYISSGGAVYGNPATCPVAEDAPTSPLCSYGVVKLAVEKYLELYKNLAGLQSVSLRVSNPFGPRQNPLGHQGVVVAILDRIHRGLPIRVWGDGSVVRDFFYVGDLADAVYKAAVQETRSRVLNIGSGIGMSLNELFSTVRAELGLDFEIRLEAGRIFDVNSIFLDISRAESEIAWSPQTPLGDALRTTWDFVRLNHGSRLTL